ncbi:hypothetical protein AJ79_05863 [Helicocarpus griseus UAMH5409]|uniref:Mid2 domain-containing protein n=1 Tax=Helicocarpus griseus UAMH5409 TaxID=1447875 RepID=A0A2B7XJQ2_9EURO|nr:hypothetical protein AJ79_05863 [Helicocarpus griseus UAMH5409]
MRLMLSPSSLLIVVSLCSAAARALTCFAPDGRDLKETEAYAKSKQEPHSCSTQGIGACCVQGQTCGDDNLCRGENNVTTREYCMDRTWPDSCSQLCLEPKWGGAGIQLTVCEENVYCCGPNNQTCCEKGEGTRLDPSNGRVLAIGTSSLPPLATSTPSVPPSPGITEGSNGTAGAGEGRGAGGGKGGTGGGKKGGGGGGGGGGGSNISAGAGAGIGIGSVAGLVLFGLLGWFYIRERRKRKALESGRAPLPASSRASAEMAGYPSKSTAQYQPTPQFEPPAREMDGTRPVREIDGAPMVYEVGDTSPRAELGGDVYSSQKRR